MALHGDPDLGLRHVDWTASNTAGQRRLERQRRRSTWSRATAARLDRVSDGIEQAALTLNRSASAIHDTVADTTHAIKTAASYVATPRAALALGVLRGLQWFRRMRAERAARAAASKPRLVFHNR